MPLLPAIDRSPRRFVVFSWSASESACLTTLAAAAAAAAELAPAADKGVSLLDRAGWTQADFELGRSSSGSLWQMTNEAEAAIAHRVLVAAIEFCVAADRPVARRCGSPVHESRPGPLYLGI